MKKAKRPTPNFEGFSVTQGKISGDAVTELKLGTFDPSDFPNYKAQRKTHYDRRKAHNDKWKADMKLWPLYAMVCCIVLFGSFIGFVSTLD